MSKTRERAHPAVPVSASVPNARAAHLRTFDAVHFVPKVRRVHPGLRPYPPLRFHPELELRDKAARLTQSLLRRLRIWRIEQRLTRAELAELSAIPSTAIKRAEREGQLSLERFVTLALQLGLEDDLSDMFAFRRHRVPSLVLAARSAERKNGRRQERERARRRDRA